MSKVDSAQLQLAIKALLNHLVTKAEGKNNSLFEGEEYISVVIALKNTPAKARVKPFMIPLKHSLYKDKSICLFTKDPHKQYKEMLEANPVEGVEKVIGISKLRKNYKQYEERRKLLATYDLFIADDAILPALPPLLGKKFFEKKRQPLAVKLGKKDIRPQLIRARDSTSMFLPAGASCMMKIGITTFTEEQLLENIMECMDAAVHHIPQKWKNVQALYLRTANSVALPFYHSLPTVTKMEGQAATVEAPVANKRKRKGLSAELVEAAPSAVVPSAKKAKVASIKSTPSKTPSKTTTVSKKTPGTVPTKKTTAKKVKKKAETPAAKGAK